MAATHTSSPPTSIDAATKIGTVRLRVSDLARSRDFYERALGFSVHGAGDRTHGTSPDLGGGESLALGVSDQRPLIELVADPSAPALDRHATGLYHLAVLVPSRLDLAFALTRLAEAGWPLDGASDHLVSEALYLSDPDGNGIEIYRDRPRQDWRRTNGALEMATLPLDLKSVLDELDGETDLQPLAPDATTIGHVHLQVADLRRAEEFYSDVLGFDVVVRGYPGALFLSAGGYHHHIGLNVWNSAGASPPPANAVGLRSFEVVLPDRAELERVLSRVRGAGCPIESTGSGSLVRDPFGIAVLFVTP
jgi:catechol 2,3-dioxygenase